MSSEGEAMSSSVKTVTSNEYAVMDKHEILGTITALIHVLDEMELANKDRVNIRVRRDGQRLVLHASSSFLVDVILSDERTKGVML